MNPRSPWTLSMLAPAAVGLGAVAGVEGVGEVIRWLSSEEHSMNLMEGLVDSADLVYFVVIIGSFLLMTRAAVDPPLRIIIHVDPSPGVTGGGIPQRSCRQLAGLIAFAPAVITN